MPQNEKILAQTGPAFQEQVKITDLAASP